MQNTEAQLLSMIESASQTGVDFLTDFGPVILAAASLGIAKDTRSFARIFETAHALVIRECNHLQDELGLIVIENRGEASGRLFVSLTAAGARTLVQTNKSREMPK